MESLKYLFCIFCQCRGKLRLMFLLSCCYLCSLLLIVQQGSFNLYHTNILILKKNVKMLTVMCLTRLTDFIFPCVKFVGSYNFRSLLIYFVSTHFFNVLNYLLELRYLKLNTIQIFSFYF